MIRLDLDTEAAGILRDCIRNHLANLSYEIANTDRKDYRDELKSRRQTLAKVESELAEGLGETSD